MENPFNAPLPDGVKLVPIDANTMKNLHSIGAAPPVGAMPQPEAGSQDVSGGSKLPPYTDTPLPSNQTPPADQSQPYIDTPPSSSNDFAVFIQSERNGALFYLDLMQHAPSQEFKDCLVKISGNCNARREKLCEAYSRQFGEAFAPKQSDTELPATFSGGLQSAISQETAAIHKLVNLYEASVDPSTAKLINCQIYSKVADIALLNMMLSHRQ